MPGSGRKGVAVVNEAVLSLDSDDVSEEGVDKRKIERCVCVKSVQ